MQKTICILALLLIITGYFNSYSQTEDILLKKPKFGPLRLVISKSPDMSAYTWSLNIGFPF